MIVIAILIILNIFVFLITKNDPNSSLIYGMNYLFLEYKLYFQPLTSMFMHANWTHLFMNMAVLFQFGTILQKEIGVLKFLLLYLIGGVITSLVSLLFMLNFKLEHTLVGASGALSVLIGFMALRDKNLRNGLIVAMLLISFAPLLLGVPVAWYGHIIGFIVGWIAALILP